ncbi:hypothetical protein XAP6164_2220019 [Xanthomonas phaseoli pv. phaseoli]|nr:hypothetical protein XAP6164_2220019 [Xanthomonas phaseoli pv. phaseoli]
MPRLRHDARAVCAGAFRSARRLRDEPGSGAGPVHPARPDRLEGRLARALVRPGGGRDVRTEILAMGLAGVLDRKEPAVVPVYAAGAGLGRKGQHSDAGRRS